MTSHDAVCQALLGYMASDRVPLVEHALVGVAFLMPFFIRTRTTMPQTLVVPFAKVSDD